jgi:O-antigen/teichoic acid export membrane protein
VNSLAIYSLLYAGSAGLQKGLGFVFFLWLAYSLTVQDYATFGLLLALQTGVAALAGAGIAESVAGLLKDHSLPQARFKLFSISNGVFLYLSLLAVVITIIVYSLPIWHIKIGVTEQVSVLIGGILIAFFTLQATLVRLEERHLESMALLFFAPLTGLCTAFIAFYIWRDVGAFYVGFVVGLLLACLGFFVAGVGYFSFSVRPKDVEPIRNTIGPYIFIALLAWLSGYGNTYIVKSLFSVNDVARFTFAYTLSSIMHLVATSTNQVWGPRFLQLVHKLPTADMERRNIRFYALQGLTIGAIGSVVLLLLPTALDTIGGNLLSYRDINIELLMLFGGYAVSIPWWHSQNYYIVYGLGNELKNVVLITTILGLVIWLIMMNLLGPLGIYVGFLTHMFIRSLGTFLWARRRWGLYLAWQGPLAALILFAAGGFAGPTLMAFGKGQ